MLCATHGTLSAYVYFPTSKTSISFSITSLFHTYRFYHGSNYFTNLSCWFTTSFTNSLFSNQSITFCFVLHVIPPTFCTSPTYFLCHLQFTFLPHITPYDVNDFPPQFSASKFSLQHFSNVFAVSVKFFTYTSQAFSFFF